jgi:hypothetical protein
MDLKTKGYYQLDNPFDSITSNADVMELMDLDSFLEQTELSLHKFTLSENIETSKIAKILFGNLRKMHCNLSTRIIEQVTGTNENKLENKFENTLPSKLNSSAHFDDKQFITQTYNVPNLRVDKKIVDYKYHLLKETSVSNYTRMLYELSELEEEYNKNPNEILHQKIKLLQTKITRQKKRILTISNKI